MSKIMSRHLPIISRPRRAQARAMNETNKREMTERMEHSCTLNHIVTLIFHSSI